MLNNKPCDAEIKFANFNNHLFFKAIEYISYGDKVTAEIEYDKLTESEDK